MNENTPKIRIRVGVETTSKGLPSWSTTAEVFDATVTDAEVVKATAEALAASDALVEQMKRRYGKLQQDGTPLGQGSMGDRVFAAVLALLFLSILNVVGGTLIDGNWGYEMSPSGGCYEVRHARTLLGGTAAMSPVTSTLCE